MVGGLVERKGGEGDFFAIVPALGSPGVLVNVGEHTVEGVLIDAGARHHCRHFRCALHEQAYFDSFPGSAKGNGVGLAGYGGITQGSHILFVNHLVAVEVLINQVAGARCAEGVGQTRGCDFFGEVEEAVAVGIIHQIAPGCAVGEALGAGKVGRAVGLACLVD